MVSKVRASTDLPHQDGERSSAADDAYWVADPARRNPKIGLPWGAGAPSATANDLRWTRPRLVQPALDARSQEALLLPGQASDMRWTRPRIINTADDLPTDALVPVAQADSVPWYNPARSYQADGVPWGAGSMAAVVDGVPWASPPIKRQSDDVPWGAGDRQRTQPHQDLRHYVEPEPPPPPPPLDFGRTYRTVPTISVIRSSDSAPVLCTGVRLSADIDSWSWSVSLQIPLESALDLIKPTAGVPVEVTITINGHTWTALIEGYSQAREFGRASWTAEGRSLTAYLAEPYSEATSYLQPSTLTAQQLADRELPVDWTLDWSAVDWSVPGGVWYYDRLDPIHSVQQIAASCGALCLPDPASKTIYVRPKYPTYDPWDWAGAITADKTLPLSHIRALQMRLDPRAQHDRVYVSGENQGVLGQITRQFAAGTSPAPMVVDKLIITTDPARERGRTVLGDTGTRGIYQISTWLVPSGSDPGLIQPGTLLEVEAPDETFAGLVTSCGVDASNGNALRVSQAITVERYLGT